MPLLNVIKWKFRIIILHLDVHKPTAEIQEEGMFKCSTAQMQHCSNAALCRHLKFLATKAGLTMFRDFELRALKRWNEFVFKIILTRQTNCLLSLSLSLSNETLNEICSLHNMNKYTRSVCCMILECSLLRIAQRQLIAW